MTQHPLAGVGLVLAGGGAKGAYQVGALRTLARAGAEVVAVAGTSIGALNGAIVAGADSLDLAAEELEVAWRRLGRERVVRPRSWGFRDLGSAGAALLAPGLAGKLSAWLVRQGVLDEGSLLDPRPMADLVRELISADKIRSGLPVFATVCPIPDFAPEIPVLDLAATWALSDAEWVHLNQVADDDLLFEFLLASAAVPLAFPSRRAGGRRYCDGGLKDHVPVEPMRQRGVKRVVIVHLDNGSTFDRWQHPDLEVIEIRPAEAIQEDERLGVGWVRALLDFSPQRIDELIKRGEEDALRVLTPLTEMFEIIGEHRAATDLLLESTRLLEES